jgi:uncharacterized SAM-binding protein YcdF (DUF218 family)
MFFILSKLLIIFLEPLLWFVGLLVAGLFVKNKALKKRLIISSVIILYVFSNKFLLDQFAKRWDVNKFPPVDQKFSCAIILGGFASADQYDQGHFNSSSDRFIQAITLLAQKRTANILISGGNSSIFKDKYQEADYVHGRLKILHVPDSQILIENKSKNTLQNAGLTKKLLEGKKLKPPYLLVTSAFHMRRALFTFKSAGLEVVPYPCDFKAGNSKFSVYDFLPNAGTIALWNYYIKEVVGYGVYSFKT